ncbi:MAG: type II toxin-antitoxin system prevent-host-death family antitoxin [Phycisphaerae bacterium]
MTTITSNELKTKGVSQIKRALEKDFEAVITVRGKAKYVVMDVERYDEVREMELDAAIAASRADIAAGRCYTGLEEHFARIDAMLEEE